MLFTITSKIYWSLYSTLGNTRNSLKHLHTFQLFIHATKKNNKPLVTTTFLLLECEQRDILSLTQLSYLFRLTLQPGQFVLPHTHSLFCVSKCITIYRSKYFRIMAAVFRTYQKQQVVRNFLRFVDFVVLTYCDACTKQPRDVLQHICSSTHDNLQYQ